MFRKSCEAIIISCIDFRIQEFIEKWAHERFGPMNYDHVAVAGGVFDLYTILRQVALAKDLHHIKYVVLMNHEDCGAYGHGVSKTRHNHDLKEAAKVIGALNERLRVEGYYIRLTGKFDQVV